MGTFLLIAPAGEGANRFDPVAIAFLLLAELGWVHGSIYSQRRAELPPSALTASGLQMLAGGGVAFVEALIGGEPGRFQPEAVSTASLLALGYLILFGSMLAYTSYAWLLRNAPLQLVATHAYVNPVVAVALGTLFLREPLSPRTIVAAGIILVAVAIIVTARGDLGSGPANEPRDELAAPGATPRGRSRRPPSGPRRSLPREDGPRDAARERHDRDHRVDPDPGREGRGVRDVEARDDAPAGIATDPAARVRGMVGRIRARPDRAHLVRRGDRSAVGREVRPGEVVLERGEPTGLVCRAIDDDAGAAARPTARISAGAAGAGEAGHRDERVAQRRPARRRRAGSRSGPARRG